VKKWRKIKENSRIKSKKFKKFSRNLKNNLEKFKKIGMKNANKKIFLLKIYIEKKIFIFFFDKWPFDKNPAKIEQKFCQNWTKMIGRFFTKKFWDIIDFFLKGFFGERIYRVPLKRAKKKIIKL
jgi:hypothetical protein